MTRFISFFSVLAFFSFFTMTATAQHDDRSEMPDVELKTMDGQTVHLKDFIKPGEITYITFWATWCSPCKKELDNLIDLYPDWKEQYGVNIVAVSVDDARTMSKVKGTVDAKGWEYQILCDPNQNAYRVLNFQSVPQAFVIDKHGKIAATHTGYKDGDEVSIEEEIKELATEE